MERWVGRTAEEEGGGKGEGIYNPDLLPHRPSSSFDDLSCESCDLANWLCEDEKGGRMQCGNFITCKFAGGLALHFYPHD